MKEVSNHSENLSSVSIRKAPAQKYATDTNQDEKVQQPILEIEALRTIGRMVRAIRDRIRAESESTKKANESDGFNGGAETPGQFGSTDLERDEAES